MSWLQRFMVRMLPRGWAERMEAESRAWKMRCPCGCVRSIWELGGIRWKASRSLTYSRMKCPDCGRRTWHKLVQAGN